MTLFLVILGPGLFVILIEQLAAAARAFEAGRYHGDGTPI